MNENPLANLGELTKPATVLIEKISDALGGIFKPYQIVRVAKAEAAAEQLRAESQIQVTDLHRRALHRFLEEEAKRQSNIEQITQKALPLLEEKSSPQNVEDDWITNFFDKCRIVSGHEMQELWARVLAGEANRPGAFSRRTVNLLGDLDKTDAELFTNLCSFVWALGIMIPLVFDTEAECYVKRGLYFSSLSHLESLGLIRFDAVAGFARTKIPKEFPAFYYGRRLELKFPMESNNQLQVGVAMLTRAGLELAPVSGSKPADGFFEFVYDRWADQLLVPKRDPAMNTP